VGHAHRERVALISAVAQDLGAERACRCFPPPASENLQFGVVEGVELHVVTRRYDQRPSFRHGGLSVLEAALGHVVERAEREGQQQSRDRSPLPRLRHPPAFEIVPGHVVVERQGSEADDHEVRQDVVRDRLVTGQCAEGSAKAPGAGLVVVVGQGREAIEQEVTDRR
jgi:hypothetical protein